MTRGRRASPLLQALWTFGHSTRTADQTVELLRRNDIVRVVDVRSFPGSRRCPWFGAEAMGGWLAEAGIEYRRIAELGGRRGRQPVDPEVNAGWSNESFHRYADWTLSEDFERGLADLAQCTQRRTAIMCSEAVPWRCHRSLIASVLTARARLARHPHRGHRFGAAASAGAVGRRTGGAAGRHRDLSATRHRAAVRLSRYEDQLHDFPPDMPGSV
jgi:uncharacterized protein (DUF488 family)